LYQQFDHKHDKQSVANQYLIEIDESVDLATNQSATDGFVEMATIETRVFHMVDDTPVDVIDDTPVDVIDDTPVDVIDDTPVDVIDDTPVQDVDVSVADENDQIVDLVEPRKKKKLLITPRPEPQSVHPLIFIKDKQQRSKTMGDRKATVKKKVNLSKKFGNEF
jgi:hypothetical protein